ncbi:MAG: aminotransferase class III-fold pyridoxal phosphate-dependent enzyme [Planctomycetota bacterium]
MGLVLLGAPIPGVELRIRHAGAEVAPGVLGEVELRGPCVTRAYRGGAGRFADGWLCTGDLGFLHAGQLVIAGRLKDVVCAGGETHHLHDLERLLREAEAGTVMLTAPWPHAERGLVAFLEHRGPQAGFAARARRVRAVLRRARGLVTHAVLPVRSLPRTTSGKLTRRPFAERYLRGEFAALEAELAPAALPGETLERVLAVLDELCPDAVDPDRPFLDAGVESRALAEAASALEVPGRPLDAGILLAAPTPRALARYLDTGELPQPPPATREPALEPIAVVGLAARLPGSDDARGFWEDLRSGAVRTGPLPASRRDDVRAAASALRGVKVEPECPPMGYLERIDAFAAAHFGIPTSEATLIHPAHRLLLELAAQALHDADPARDWRGSATGVFAAHVGDFEGVRYKELLAKVAPELLGVASIGNVGSFVAGRVAHRLDLRGPALVIDAACSASLVALHLACEALRRGECEQALVGSARVSVIPERWPVRMGFESRRGSTRPFDQDADGCVLGEGGVALLLKPLSRARQDGDRVYAVVRGSAVNHDGGAGALTAPNPSAQAAALRAAWARAQLDPRTLGFVEAHGAGTALGDPAELEALRHALGPVERAAPCWLGSAKGTVGHLFGAAGLVGFLKATLALWQGELPPTAGHARPHPELPFAAARVAVNTQPVPLAPDAVGGVTALGFSGTNAHVVVAAPPGDLRRADWQPPLALERARYWPRVPEAPDGREERSAPAARSEAQALEQVREAFARYAGVTLQPGQEDVSVFALGLDSIVLLQLQQALVEGGAALGGLETPRQLARALAHAPPASPLAAPEPPRAIPAPSLAPAPLTPAQAAHVAELTQALEDGGSKAWIDAHRDVLALNRAVAGLRPGQQELTFPLVAREAKGARLVLEDGRELIDLALGFGVHLFGHAPDWLQAALQAELARGAPLGPVSPLAGDVARRIQRLTGVERVAFFSTGTEAVSVALRLARTARGRSGIVTFAGSYHGHHEQVLGVAGPGGRALPAARGIPPELLATTRVLDYGDPASLDAIWAHADELAAVVVEPVQSRDPGKVPLAFLRELRALTRAAGIPLVFDEVITGFRVHPGGAQARFGVEADLVVYGKVLGGGLPLGVVAGRAEYLDALDGGAWRYGDGSLPQTPTTFVAGTLLPALALAASQVLARLEDGPGAPGAARGAHRRPLRAPEPGLPPREVASRRCSTASWFRIHRGQ